MCKIILQLQLYNIILNKLMYMYPVRVCNRVVCMCMIHKMYAYMSVQVHTQRPLTSDI